nr:retrovirus-related Pol polyprotein from transposon TNT 1-94 [Tanacetum cinerariifolium]
MFLTKWNPTILGDPQVPMLLLYFLPAGCPIVLWYLDSGCSKHMTGDRSQLINFVQKFLGTVKFRNDHVAKILGYRDYKIGNVTISWVYYVEGLGHNLFSIGQFCDSDLEVRLNVPVGRIRTDNGTEFVNQTLRVYYEEVGIYHETSVARSPQQNGVVERRNRTLIEAARNYVNLRSSSVISMGRGYGNRIKLPDLSFFHVFGALCYPTNDSENLGKLQPKADIGIFIGYAPTKKAFRIYNRRTRRIVETIHVDFDELTTMASEQSTLGPALHDMTLGTISSGLVLTNSSSTSYVPPTRNDWDLLFQSMFDELLNHPPSGVNQAPEAIAPIVEVIPPVNADLTGSPSSTMVEQDALSMSNSTTPTETQSSVIHQDAGDDNLDIEVAYMGSDPLVGIPIPKINSEQSTIPASPQVVMQTDHPLPHNNSKWTKDHPLNNSFS